MLEQRTCLAQASMRYEQSFSSPTLFYRNFRTASSERLSKEACSSRASELSKEGKREAELGRGFSLIFFKAFRACIS